MSLFDPKNRCARVEAYYALQLQQYTMPDHHHNRCEIMYVSGGVCGVTAAGREVRLREGDFVVLDQNVPHSLHLPRGGNCTLLNLEFSCRGGDDGCDYRRLAEHSPGFEAFLRQPPASPFGQDSGKLGHAMKDLIQELERKARRDPYLLELLFSRLFIELSRCFSQLPRGSAAAYVASATRYIDAHLGDALDVGQIAAQAGVNAAYLQSLFAKQFGCGIMAYAGGQRLDKAAFLLQNSTLPVADIATQTGFHSRQHFGHMFTKRYHMSPRQFRAGARQAAAPGAAKKPISSEDFSTRVITPGGEPGEAQRYSRQL